MKFDCQGLMGSVRSTYLLYGPESPGQVRLFEPFPEIQLVVLFLAQSTCIYRVQSNVWRLPNFWPPPSLHPASVSSPRTKGGRVHTRRAVRGQYFGRRQTLDWPLTYSIIPLRFLGTEIQRISTVSRQTRRHTRFPPYWRTPPFWRTTCMLEY